MSLNKHPTVFSRVILIFARALAPPLPGTWSDDILAFWHSDGTTEPQIQRQPWNCAQQQTWNPNIPVECPAALQATATESQRSNILAFRQSSQAPDPVTVQAADPDVALESLQEMAPELQPATVPEFQ